MLNSSDKIDMIFKGLAVGFILCLALACRNEDDYDGKAYEMNTAYKTYSGTVNGVSLSITLGEYSKLAWQEATFHADGADCPAQYFATSLDPNTLNVVFRATQDTNNIENCAKALQRPLSFNSAGKIKELEIDSTSPKVYMQAFVEAAQKSGMKLSLTVGEDDTDIIAGGFNKLNSNIKDNTLTLSACADGPRIGWVKVYTLVIDKTIWQTFSGANSLRAYFIYNRLAKCVLDTQLKEFSAYPTTDSMLNDIFKK